MINLVAPINNLGYGIAGYNLAKSLIKLDSRVALYPISTPEQFENMREINRGISNQYLLRKDFPCVKIWHQHDLHSSVGNKKYFGFPIFELTEFSDLEKNSMKHCDAMLVCSDWAKSVVLKNNIFKSEDVFVIPLGVDMEIFHPLENAPQRKSTIFFNCGKWEKRKGHDILLECFNSAFEHDDDVELWMMCDNPFIGNMNNDWKNLYKNSKLGSKIKIIPRQKTQKDLYNIIIQADCGVFPARAEGWNLELLEMMACGKSVIATNYSAHTQFCNDNNCMLVNVENLETAFDGVFFSGQYGTWAELAQPQKEQIISYMRIVHQKKQNGINSINQNGIKTAMNFSWSNSAKELLNAVRF